MHSPIIIIGAGPAGLLAAIAAGDKALILERNQFAGHKLLLSGSGKCNFSNSLAKEDFLKALRENSNTLKPALYSFDSSAFKDILEANGCPVICRDDGKYFPASLHSADIRDTLLRFAIGKGAHILYRYRIKGITQQPSGSFKLSSEDMTFTCSRLILACGGMSYPQTGSDGSGYALAKLLGHKISSPHQHLAGVELTDNQRFRNCPGVSFKNIKLSLCTPNGKLTDYGDILFTHKGLSGPVILNNAYLLAPGSSFALTFVEDADAKLQKLINRHARSNLSNLLKYLDLPESFIGDMLQYLEIDPGMRASDLRAKSRNLISAFLTAAVFHVRKLDSFDEAMASTGGILLKDINSRTMESRIRSGLYIAGEMLDYHAPSGGFNIQLAASTGWLAGSMAAQSL